jgi:hypothetical protein
MTTPPHVLMAAKVYQDLAYRMHRSKPEQRAERIQNALEREVKKIDEARKERMLKIGRLLEQEAELKPKLKSAGKRVK